MDDAKPRRMLLRARLTPATFGKACAVALPLALGGSLAAASSSTAWHVAGARSAADTEWMNSLTGEGPRAATGQGGAAPGPDTPVVPIAGDPQHLAAGAPLPAMPVDLSQPAPAAGNSTVPGQLAASGIPVRALQAYVAAADIAARTDPACHLSWSLLAGIGRVESNHGRYGGATIHADGVVSPAIYGPRLNGTGGMPMIRDTDGGRLDGDPNADRAVGPMEFIPGTWASFGSDADGNGVADPQDLDDAALSAGRYLCFGQADLATQKGRWEAVYRYNHSSSYVGLVLALADSYATGKAVAIPTIPAGASTRSALPPATNTTAATTVPTLPSNATTVPASTTSTTSTTSTIAGLTTTAPAALPPETVAGTQTVQAVQTVQTVTVTAAASTTAAISTPSTSTPPAGATTTAVPTATTTTAPVTTSTTSTPPDTATSTTAATTSTDTATATSGSTSTTTAAATTAAPTTAAPTTAAPVTTASAAAPSSTVPASTSAPAAATTAAGAS